MPRRRSLCVSPRPAARAASLRSHAPVTAPAPPARSQAAGDPIRGRQYLVPEDLTRCYEREKWPGLAAVPGAGCGCPACAPVLYCVDCQSAGRWRLRGGSTLIYPGRADLCLECRAPDRHAILAEHVAEMRRLLAPSPAETAPVAKGEAGSTPALVPSGWTQTTERIRELQKEVGKLLRKQPGKKKGKKK